MPKIVFVNTRIIILKTITNSCLTPAFIARMSKHSLDVLTYAIQEEISASMSLKIAQLTKDQQEEITRYTKYDKIIREHILTNNLKVTDDESFKKEIARSVRLRDYTSRLSESKNRIEKIKIEYSECKNNKERADSIMKGIMDKTEYNTLYAVELSSEAYYNTNSKTTRSNMKEITKLKQSSALAQNVALQEAYVADKITQEITKKTREERKELNSLQQENMKELEEEQDEQGSGLSSFFITEFDAKKFMNEHSLAVDYDNIDDDYDELIIPVNYSRKTEN